MPTEISAGSLMRQRSSPSDSEAAAKFSQRLVAADKLLPDSFSSVVVQGRSENGETESMFGGAANEKVTMEQRLNRTPQPRLNVNEPQWDAAFGQPAITRSLPSPVCL